MVEKIIDETVVHPSETTHEAVAASCVNATDGFRNFFRKALGRSSIPDDNGVNPTSNLSGLLDSGKLTMLRMGDIENGQLGAKLENLKRSAGVTSWNNRATVKQKLVNLMHSDDYAHAPICVDISEGGVVHILDDGNTRIYAAMVYDIDPSQIPVYCYSLDDRSRSSCGKFRNATLAEVLKIANAAQFS